MGRLDQLPADQRAVLQLLLKQGKSYDDIAGLLRIERSAVQARAQEALDALGPEDTAGLTDARQDEVGDYLLGQQGASQRQATREFLEGSAPGRAWGRVVASELRALAPEGLPEIPAEGAELDEAFDALEARRAARTEHERSSKLGGVLLLVGLGIAVAVVLVLLLSGGGDDDKKTGAVGGTTSTQTSTDGSSTTPQVEAQINLFPPGGGKSPLGVANIVSQQGQRGIALVGQDMPATNGQFAYAMWLVNDAGGAKRLGFFGEVKKNGRMQGFVLAPDDFADFSKLEVTRETSKDPKSPGPVVLSGDLPKS